MGESFILLGILFLTGLAVDALGQRTRLPRVTLLLLIGVLAGPDASGLIPEAVFDWYDPIATLAQTENGIHRCADRKFAFTCNKPLAQTAQARAMVVPDGLAAACRIS